ncbi:unnamed protein product [Brassica rapa]|uniref:Uncharacterized protein n=2 Tax=Brassica TaxID=3705 RepID=A0A8D9H800_BRACM|nr:unnamed protein product [Brassica napus]CAG7894433.1 unnamed protein product [Brassica rapa]
MVLNPSVPFGKRPKIPSPLILQEKDLRSQGDNTHVTTAKVTRHGYTKFKQAICGQREIFIAGVCSTRS